MKLLLHVCCAPCAIYPLRILREAGIDVMGFFYRHNIHPFTECLKREETVKSWAETVSLDVIYQEGYELEAFLRNAAFREKNRCMACYQDRLAATAKIAKKGRFDAFTTTLLYSKFQKHDTILAMGRDVAETIGVEFYYDDFRYGWKEGITESKRLGLYRQQYCGCIYSEKDRYYTSSRHTSPKNR